MYSVALCDGKDEKRWAWWLKGGLKRLTWNFERQWRAAADRLYSRGWSTTRVHSSCAVPRGVRSGRWSELFMSKVGPVVDLESCQRLGSQWLSITTTWQCSTHYIEGSLLWTFVIPKVHIPKTAEKILTT